MFLEITLENISSYAFNHWHSNYSPRSRALDSWLWAKKAHKFLFVIICIFIWMRDIKTFSEVLFKQKTLEERELSQSIIKPHWWECEIHNFYLRHWIKKLSFWVFLSISFFCVFGFGFDFVLFCCLVKSFYSAFFIIYFVT